MTRQKIINNILIPLLATFLLTNAAIWLISTVNVEALGFFEFIGALALPIFLEFSSILNSEFEWPLLITYDIKHFTISCFVFTSIFNLITIFSVLGWQVRLFLSLFIISYLLFVLIIGRLLKSFA